MTGERPGRLGSLRLVLVVLIGGLSTGSVAHPVNAQVRLPAPATAAVPAATTGFCDAFLSVGRELQTGFRNWKGEPYLDTQGKVMPDTYLSTTSLPQAKDCTVHLDPQAKEFGCFWNATRRPREDFDVMVRSVKACFASSATFGTDDSVDPPATIFSFTDGHPSGPSKFILWFDLDSGKVLLAVNDGIVSVNAQDQGFCETARKLESASLADFSDLKGRLDRDQSDDSRDVFTSSLSLPNANKCVVLVEKDDRSTSLECNWELTDAATASAQRKTLADGVAACFPMAERDAVGSSMFIRSDRALFQVEMRPARFGFPPRVVLGVSKND